MGGGIGVWVWVWVVGWKRMVDGYGYVVDYI